MVNQELVHIENKDIYTTSEIVAKGTGNQHRTILQLIESHKNRFESFGSFAFEMRKSKGRPTKIYILNEEHVTFLITLLRNNEKVLDFKQKLVKEFFKMKKTLQQIAINQKNNEWLENRRKGITARKQETDIIKKFIEYAEKQGSKSAFRYYENITKMEYKHLYFITGKFKNIRDVLSGRQISFQITCDEIVKKALTEGMKEDLYYKEIFQKAKKNVMSFAELMPKTNVPEIENSSSLSIN